MSKALAPNFCVTFYFPGKRRRTFVIPAKSALVALQEAAAYLLPAERESAIEVSAHRELDRPVIWPKEE